MTGSVNILVSLVCVFRLWCIQFHILEKKRRSTFTANTLLQCQANEAFDSRVKKRLNTNILTHGKMLSLLKSNPSFLLPLTFCKNYHNILIYRRDYRITESHNWHNYYYRYLIFKMLQII